MAVPKAATGCGTRVGSPRRRSAASPMPAARERLILLPPRRGDYESSGLGHDADGTEHVAGAAAEELTGQAGERDRPPRKIDTPRHVHRWSSSHCRGIQPCIEKSHAERLGRRRRREALWVKQSRKDLHSIDQAWT